MNVRIAELRYWDQITNKHTHKYHTPPSSSQHTYERRHTKKQQNTFRINKRVCFILKHKIWSSSNFHAHSFSPITHPFNYRMDVLLHSKHIR